MTCRKERTCTLQKPASTTGQAAHAWRNTAAPQPDTTERGAFWQHALKQQQPVLLASTHPDTSTKGRKTTTNHRHKNSYRAFRLRPAAESQWVDAGHALHLSRRFSKLGHGLIKQNAGNDSQISPAFRRRCSAAAALLLPVSAESGTGQQAATGPRRASKRVWKLVQKHRSTETETPATETKPKPEGGAVVSALGDWNGSLGHCTELLGIWGYHTGTCSMRSCHCGSRSCSARR